MCLSPKPIQRFNITRNTIANNTAEWGGEHPISQHPGNSTNHILQRLCL
jgi:hypothetical protein